MLELHQDRDNLAAYQQKEFRAVREMSASSLRIDLDKTLDY